MICKLILARPVDDIGTDCMALPARCKGRVSIQAISRFVSSQENVGCKKCTAVGQKHALNEIARHQCYDEGTRGIENMDNYWSSPAVVHGFIYVHRAAGLV